MALLEKNSGPRDSPSQEIVCVTRGESVEVFRIRLIEADSALLERYENGEFLPGRLLCYAASSAEVNRLESSNSERLERAVRHALTYLDGSVTVGERDLLSPTSAMTRNLRWFPGDLQMLGTSFHYLRELFPSAQFHVSQLFRRVFGDAAFLGLILFSSACWLRTRSHAGLATFALALQFASIVAIIGFDRFWEPIRYRFREIRRVRSPNDGLRGALEFIAIVPSQLLHGLAAVTVNTLIGLTNLLIHPVKIVESFQKVRHGRSLEWKASSASTGQDIRGWPVSDFLDAYGGAACVGLVLLFFLCWLVLLGAPLDLFGLNSVGLFLASFLSAWFYAWHAALPRSAENGVPQYALSRAEFWGLTLIGLAGLLISATLFCIGLYPMPGFESSAGVVALFLTGTCAFAAIFPSYYGLKRRSWLARAADARAGVGLRSRGLWLALMVGLGLGLGLFASPGLRDRARQFFAADKTRFRIREAERQVYLGVGAALKKTRAVDPEPLLSAGANQATLGSTPRSPVLDARELRGIPSARPKRLARRQRTTPPEQYALPQAERIPTNKPRRDFVLANAEPAAHKQPAQAERLNAVIEARRRARTMIPRVLTEAELAEQRRFIAEASYPWISREALEQLGAADARGARLPLLEMARVHRFDQVSALWDRVPAATQGEVAPSTRFDRLLDGIDGAVSLGLDPDAPHVQAFVAQEREVTERWPREFPNVPLGVVREHVTGTPSNAFLVARYLSIHGLSFDDLARRLRLDYLNSAWNRPPIAPNVRQLFHDRVELEEQDPLTLDWGDSVEAQARFDGLQTEQLLATKVLRAALGSRLASSDQIERVLRLVEAAVSSSDGAAASPLTTALAQNFQIEAASRAADSASQLLRAELWAQTMSGRIGQIAANVSADTPLPGTELDHALLAEVSRRRYPDDGGAPVQRRALDWLTLVDASETYRELVDGYQRFRRELVGRGYTALALERAPNLSPAELWQDLFFVWRELPARYPNIPARADLVGEFVCQTAYFSSADHKHGRTPAAFVHDFQAVFEAVNQLMTEAPPALLQELTDAASLETRGRLSRDPEARRFFAWWGVVSQTRVVNYNLERHRLERTVKPRDLARAWAEMTSSGLARWPHLPWRVPGFTEYFLNLQYIEGLTLPALWQQFEPQLDRADALSALHVVPSGKFEALVERRISDRTGSPNFDPRTRRANAIVALAELVDVASDNGLHFDDTHAARLSELIGRLYEDASRDYPSLYWEGDGIVESYALLGLVNGWSPERTLREFAPEWSLANALAASGLLDRLDTIADSDPAELAPQDRALHTFIDTQTLRLRKRTGLRQSNARSSAMNALIALSNLVLSAGEEGLWPNQAGCAWDKQRVRSWAVTLGSSHTLAQQMSNWIAELASDFGELVSDMRTDGPQFPWEDGAFVETQLLVARSAGASVETTRAARRGTWRAASDLAVGNLAVPSAFVQLIERDSRKDLARKLATARGIPAEKVPDSELRALEDPEILPESARLSLADVLAQIRIAYGTDPDPTALARALVNVRDEGPRRYPNVPWAAKGFASSLLVAAERTDFHGDVWRYARFIDLPAVDHLLAEADEENVSAPLAKQRPPAEAHIPSEVLSDVKAIMTQQTGRTPSSERIVAFQALRDGLFLLKEFLPDVPPALSSALALVQIRARVRGLAERFPALHIAIGEDLSPRVGFADRLAAIAARQSLSAGARIDDPTFADKSVQLLETQFLNDLNRIYALVRRSFSTEELEYYRQAIQHEVRRDNARKAQQSGVSPSSLSVPQVNEEDLVADFALYELLYAREIGQSPAYVVDLFQIYDTLRGRADVQAEYQRELSALDREAQVLRAKASDDASFRNAPEYAAWLEKRGDFVKRTRGNLLSLSRTFALLKQTAFSPSAAPEARAAFARFGDFDHYLARFFDDLTIVRHTPGFAVALTELAQRDPFLADGVEFAIARFKLHVLDTAYPAPSQSALVTRRIAEFLSQVKEDYRAGLGYDPGLESGVPFYDALHSFVRADVQSTAGSGVLRRLNVVQRGLQSWPQTYFLKQAYKILFDRELDEDDPTPLPAESRFQRVLHRRVGDSVREFLESKLPERLARETGSHDLVSWIKWLMENGELDLDARTLGKNPYAETVAGYERRLAAYRARIQLGEASGANVRAERQRVLDLEREYGSLQQRVTLLQTNAAAQARFYSRASRDYHEAIWQSAFWLLAMLAFGGLARMAASRAAPTRSRKALHWSAVAGVLCALSLGALPFWVASNPTRAERWAGRPLDALRLLEFDEQGAIRARGASAQLERTEPWTVLARASTTRNGARP